MSAVTDFLARLAESCAQDTFVKLSLSTPAEDDAPVQRVTARLVHLQGVPHLSIVDKEERRDTTKNVPVARAIEDLGARLSREFRSAMLATTAADWQLQNAHEGGGRLIRHKPSERVAPKRVHDEAKPTFLGEAAQPFLQAIGLVDEKGRPKQKLADKHAQVDRYVEILSHLAKDCGFDRASESPLRIADIGCGKGHLTFALWHLCTNVLQREAAVLGVEVRKELVDGANALAQTVGASGLAFVRGDVADVELPQLDALVALHACNTATDHAIRRGLELSCKLIVVAPCCHQEVRPQLAQPEPLTAALQHGLFAERMAEWATDALRAMVLEQHGYAVKAIEFVSSEHSGKNLMLAAVKRERAPTEAELAAMAARLAAFRSFFGIERQSLFELLPR